VGEGAALPHRIPGAGDPDEHGVAVWIPHRQAVLIGAGVEHGYIDPGRLLNDRYKVTQWLYP
jgi:hypothetical protein